MSEITHAAHPKEESSSMYALSFALLVGFALLAGSVWFSSAAIADSISGLDSTLASKTFGTTANSGSGAVVPTPTPTPSPAPTPQPSSGSVDVASRAIRGISDAKVTIVEFSDYECPFCARATPTIDKLMVDYDGKVNRVFMQFPLSFHPSAQKAAEASECAGDQNKFWEYHDKLFESGQLSVAQLKAHAVTLGLNAETFNTCLDSGKKASVVSAHQAVGQAVGVSGTPSFIIGTMSNGKVTGSLVVGAQPYETFKAAIDAKLSG